MEKPVVTFNALFEFSNVVRKIPKKGKLIRNYFRKETKYEDRNLEKGRCLYLRSRKTAHRPANWPFYLFLQQSILLLNTIPVFLAVNWNEKVNQNPKPTKNRITQMEKVKNIDK